MAGRPIKSTSENTNAKVNTNSKLEKENKDLKAQLDNMMKIITELQQQANNASNNGGVDTSLNRRVSITSLTTGGVNLKTSSEGNAKRFRLEGIGHRIPIIYEDLVNCINTDRWIFEDGIVYINDKQAVEENYLEDYYKKFLDADTINNILDFDSEVIEEMITNTTENIKETICAVVANKINKNESVDWNKVQIIEKVSGINIKDLANKLK